MIAHEDLKFAEDLVATFPARWQKRLLAFHAKTNQQGLSFEGEKVIGFSPDLQQSFVAENINANTPHRAAANATLRILVGKLGSLRLPLDATDSDICLRAEELAIHAIDFARITHNVEILRVGMNSFVVSCGLVPPPEDMDTAPAIARMTCPMWWRRGLRRLHAKAVEGSAIQLGYVNQSRDLYVSNETLKRRTQQLKRNRLALENTMLVNDEEQEFQLSELVDKGIANKSIRRGELMTRIAGFEVIARECGHEGLFLTITCPSRMHKFSKVGKNVFLNRKYDGTLPEDAQAYLSECWARVRTALKRRGLGIYGFRIAEPHHDGCPHWHILIFHAAETNYAIVEVFRRYFLADSPDEAGAKEHRVKPVTIDFERGTAAGYIAKYVAKNIDGANVDFGTHGHSAKDAAARVEAWASTWAIRQFQQVGGVPVGVWRELRRVKEVPADAPAHLVDAWVAVNKIVSEDETKKADWSAYVKAQGGVFVGRDALIKIAKEDYGVIGRYGEVLPPSPIGVITAGFGVLQDGAQSLMQWFVKSVRHVWWVVVSKRACPPRTGVNNCTSLSQGEAAATASSKISGAFGFVRGSLSSMSKKVLERVEGDSLLVGVKYDAWAVLHPEFAKAWEQRMPFAGVARDAFYGMFAADWED